MSAYLGKFHVGIDGEGYIISTRNAKRYYQKKRAPSFVSKFGGGDSSYRDASFWQFFVQTNWRNGAKQLKFDDAGKFWKSSNVDVTTLEQITLSKAMESAGQLAADIKVNTIESWRTDPGTSAFGDGSDSTKTISADTTDAPLDATCTGTSGSTSLSFASASATFASTSGKPVLIHQTRGTGAGTYQKNKITAVSGTTSGTLTLQDPLNASYVTGAQVIVLPQYTVVTVDSTKTWTAKAWDGSKGGILAFLASTSTTVTGNISASSKGYRGGTVVDTSAPYNEESGEGTNGAAAVQTTANGNGGGGGYYSGGGDGWGHGGGGGNGTVGEIGYLPGTGGTAGAAGGTSGNAALTTMTFGGGGGAAASWDDASTNGDGGAGGGIIFIFSKTLTVTGTIVSNGGNGVVSGVPSYGGGGAGGSILIKAQTATLGSGLITANGGTGGSSLGDGGVGRIHISYSTSYTGTSTPTIDASQDATLADTPSSTTSTAYAGGSNGKIYSWDNATTWTEAFDTRRLAWYEPTEDANQVVGDTGGTETAQAQSFQLAAATTVKGIQVYLKKNAGTPGDITVRIETENTAKPSGTLANANATATIPAFTTSTYGWVTVEFTTAFSLSATTAYWIVLKTAAAGNDNNYVWAALTTGAYASGTNAVSTDGGSTWTAGTKDQKFRVLGQTTSVNCSLITKVGGTKKMYFGTGSETGTTNGDARLYSFDGTTWALTKTFVTATESVINSIAEYSDGKVYIGVGPQGRVQQTSDFSTFTVSKDIDIPQNPGYVYTMKEYNSYLYVGGGSPELVPTQYYNGFMNFYDQSSWRILYPFDFTVIKSMEFYDAYLFMGTYHGQLYVYDTSALNPLFNFKDQYEFQQQVYCMKYFDDKLFVGLYPQDGTADTNTGLWVFERHGLFNAHSITGVTGYRSMAVVNGSLLVGTGNSGYVYKLSTTNYETQGWYQSSYFDANLPSIDKLYKEVTIKHDALATGQSVVVYYKYAESSDWTTLGTSNTVGATEKTISFPTATYSKKITLKVELNTTTVTGSPKVTEVIMKYTLYPARKWQWTMRLMCKKNLQLLDRTTDTKTATVIRGNLEDLLSNQSLYEFVDIDGTTYTVLANEVDQSSWVVQQDDTNEDEIVISLVEA